MGRLVSRTCLGVALLVTFGGLVLLPRRIQVDLERFASFSADDAAAMAWLGEHATPGALMANDGSADAGIWAPEKAGVRVLLPRFDLAPRAEQRQLIATHIASLGADPEIRDAACALGVEYVFSGAKGTGFYEPKRFPPVAELRASPWLEEVFASGDAAIFRARLACP